MKSDYSYSQHAIKLLDQLEFLFEKYSDELRATTQPYYLRRVKDKVPQYEYHPEDTLIRETLMEHVGSLPMVATAIYPNIADSEVDLGQSLIMLAIHDIGELITGDEMTFTKKPSAKDSEHAAALSLLDTSYHEIYEDVESQASASAKFAIKRIKRTNCTSSKRARCYGRSVPANTCQARALLASKLKIMYARSPYR